MSNNKHEVTFTFPTEELLQEFLGWWSDGGGEQQLWDIPYLNTISFDYKRCFPAWGWKEGTPRFIDAEIIKEESDIDV